jgi:hypothetical protein
LRPVIEETEALGIEPAWVGVLFGVGVGVGADGLVCGEADAVASESSANCVGRSPTATPEVSTPPATSAVWVAWPASEREAGSPAGGVSVAADSAGPWRERTPGMGMAADAVAAVAVAVVEEAIESAELDLASKGCMSCSLMAAQEIRVREN